jgi:hypothetical protein
MSHDRHYLAKVIGESLILAVAEISIASVELSSKYSVMNFSKDQATLQSASNALTSYVIIGSVWAIGSSLLLYAQFGQLGLICGLTTNFGLMLWIVWSYHHSFKKAAETYGLEYPELFKAIV